MPLNIDIQQVLLHMLNFVILFAVLYFLLYKPVKKFIDGREEYCKDIEKRTETTLSDAEELKREYSGKLESAQKEIQKMKSDAADEAEKEADEIKDKARQEAGNIIEKARAEAEKEKSNILNGVNPEICKLAQDAAEKIVFESTSDAYDSFLDITDGDE